MKSIHILLIDPIAYCGGSKIATGHILDGLDANISKVTILTNDPDSWPTGSWNKVALFDPRLLASKEQGIGYFLRHFLMVFSILWARIRYGRIDVALGASGPGVDLSMYMARKLLGYRVVQLIHGPVACSKTIGRALLVADRVYYLDSSLASLTRAIKSFLPETTVADIQGNGRFCAFSNGLPSARWPTESIATTVGVFWAASLLKWKGLATLLEALRITPSEDRAQTQICFIKPRATNLEMGPGPEPLEGVTWHENPACLDRIRSECSIFVSTSKHEPFGLSILESMAAGLAVIIPRDGAYWDLRLNDKSDCLKFTAEDPADLALKIRYLQQNPKQIEKLGRRAQQIAQQYRAELVYADIVQDLASAGSITSNACPDSRYEFDNV